VAYTGDCNPVWVWSWLVYEGQYGYTL